MIVVFQGEEISEGDRLVLINGRKIKSKEKVIASGQNYIQYHIDHMYFEFKKLTRLRETGS